MWAVVCMGIYDYTILSVNLFEDFDKAARFIRSEAEKATMKYVNTTIISVLKQIIRLGMPKWLSTERSNIFGVPTLSVMCVWIVKISKVGKSHAPWSENLL